MVKRYKNTLSRLINRYIGSEERNSISYWQKFIFYTISFSGSILGTLAILATAVVLSIKARFPAAVVVLGIYSMNILALYLPILSVKVKTMVIAFNFYLFGFASIFLAGPVGECGIFFSVCVLLCSLFAGLKTSVFFATLNFLTEITFGILHTNGIIGWDFIVEFPFVSWLLQSINIFMLDMMFVITNTMLIKGIGNTFTSLSSAEVKILTSLREKDTLIRELYHRSKNNMQVVSSMLSLHMNRLNDDAARDVFKDIINKIIAMSLVHQKLYESGDLSNIAMADYIRDLVHPLMRSYGVSSEKVKIVFDLEEISMLIDTAIPCGLVISEIIANALKHAFPDGSSGRITVSLKALDNEFIELGISDNGIGAGPDFNVSTDGKLGMKTLFTIVKHQLQGTVDFSTQGGFSFIVRFKRNLYFERLADDGRKKENSDSRR